METASYNSLGGTIILLALFAQNYIFGKLTEHAIKNELKEHVPLYKKDTEKNSPMETTN